MITPQTHPNKYWILDHEGFKWHCPTYIWNDLSEGTEDKLLETYKLEKPEELKDGIHDFKKYNEWRKTGTNYGRTIAKHICIPIDNAPPLEGDLFALLSNDEVGKIVNFIKPVTITKDSALTAVTANVQ
jgi:hypothetical protein